MEVPLRRLELALVAEEWLQAERMPARCRRCEQQIDLARRDSVPVVRRPVLPAERDLVPAVAVAPPAVAAAPRLQTPDCQHYQHYQQRVRVVEFVESREVRIPLEMRSGLPA